MIQRYFENTPVRVEMKDGNPWFVAKDLCDVLGTATRDVSKILDSDEVDTIHIGNRGGRPNVFVNESGMYGLIIRSRKPEAKEFRKWITSEVLPKIRKTGKYEIQTEDDIQQKMVDVLSRSKHPVTQEQWEVNRSGKNVRFDLVHRNSRHVHVFELKNRALTADDILEKLFRKDYHGAVLNLAGKRKASFWFIANEVSPEAREMLKALSKEGIEYSAMDTRGFYDWARTLVGRDFPGFDWYYNNVLDGQLTLEAV